MKKIQTRVMVFSLALCALVLNGCFNLFLEKPQLKSSPETSAPDIPDGFGAIRVDFSRGAARTVMPAPELSVLYLEYRFSKDGGPAEARTPGEDNKFVLEPGTYSLEVKGFVDGAHNDLAAQGTTDADFIIAAGVDAGTVALNLHPVVSGEGTGSLAFGLEYPAGTVLETLTLTRIAGEDPINLNSPVINPTGTDPLSLNGTRANIPVGYYILRVRLRNPGGEYAGKSEVVHIYQNLTARTALEEYTFSAADFGAILVTNANDAGPGSLRQAIFEANAQGGGIRVIVPSGSAIELASVLPQITKNVTIEGNGVTLTRAASWTAANDNSQLLLIGSAGVVTVRRVHFKNGLANNYGGAVRNFGTLTLESCILSGNRTTGSNAVGGAISSGAALTIRGCTFYGNTAGYRGGALDFSGTALTLEGNLFYGNTGEYPVVFNTGSGTVTASYNVVDAALGTGTTDSGWTAGTGDTFSAALPVSPKTFRVLDGGPAEGALTALPGDYPAVDFYGQPISAGGAAGAVQAVTASGSYLDLSVNNPLAGSISVNPLPDEDGLVPNGSVTITANPNGGDCSFEYWLINGVSQAASPHTLTVSTHTRIQGVFSRVVTVSSTGDSGSGTLREALGNAQDGDIIRLSGVTPGATAIELTSALPEITKSIIIEGKGVTLTRTASWTASAVSQLLRISGSAEVTIRGVHFKDGLSNSGGAVYNSGILTLESCIFSGNSANGAGGAIYSANTLTLLGCTFYGNTGANNGAVYFDASGKTLTLTGNLFYGNTGGSYPAVRVNNGSAAGSYNIVDAILGTGSGESGWTAGTGDTQAAVLPLSPMTFKVLYGNAAAVNLPSSLPTGYPGVDFYGQSIGGNGAAGAVQAVTAASSSYLDLSVNHGQRGNVSVNAVPDGDGMVPNGSITVTATPNPGYVFASWLVDGVSTTNPNPYTFSISASTRIQAVFWPVVDTFSDWAGSDTVPGTLRYALANAQDGDVIRFNGVTAGATEIELQSPLPGIGRSITLEGNGVTLTRAALWTVSDTSQLLRVDANATIRRIHFKNGLATNGGAIYKGNVSLTLESCIFSGNRSINSRGGAVYSSGGSLRIRGCTFYGNTAGTYGGVIYYSQAGVTLTGNLFYGNTAVSNPVVRNGSAGIGYWPSGSYNVADVSIGRGETESGWDIGTGDTTSTGPLVSGKTFKLLSGSAAAAKLPGTLPADYPTTDFYGQSISGGGAAGAVQAAVSGGGYYLELSVNNPLAGSVSASFTPDQDGLVSSGSATLTASSGTAPYSFAYWLQDGVRIATNPSCTVNISAQTRIQGVYSIDVTTFAGAGSDTTPGTLRYALANAQDDDVIRFSGVSPGITVLELEGPLPTITKNITIEGEGITLTRAASWTGSDSYSQLLTTDNATTTVTVRRIHFKDGLGNVGGAIYREDGALTLESCIFSGNRADYSSAVYSYFSYGPLIIRGCTFYGNTAVSSNGRVINSSSNGPMILTGNLFYGNTAESCVVYGGSGSGSMYSYNVVDAALGTGTGQSGWDAGTGDLYSAAMSVSGRSFKVLSGSPAAVNLPTTLPAGYPTVDFYGQPISGGGAAGAVQAVTAAGGYYLGLSVNNSSAGTVSVNNQPDGDDLYPVGSVITAVPNAGWSLWYWLVDGVKTTAPSLTLSAHVRIQAVFCRSVTVFTDGAGSEATPGTLRYALTNAESGDAIVFSGLTPGVTTITLDSPLPAILGNVTIEGNGVILTPASTWNRNNTSQLLTIGTPPVVKISGVHFKGGLANNNGSAIRNYGTLTLESCIFSNNFTESGGYPNTGGAIFSASSSRLTIRGCTFYGNTVNYPGSGAVYLAADSFLTLTGNLFYGNTNTAPVVKRNSGVSFSASCNVVDVAYGTSNTQAGWTAGTGDTTFTDLSISGTPFNTTSFVPVSALQSVLSSAPTDFPETDFNGNTRTFPGAPGAVR